MDIVAANARSKAAAWAWYQRTSGSVVTRSEVAIASPHRSVRGCPSRFKLEADLLLSGASIQDNSDRLESLHLSKDSSNSSSDGAIDRSDMLPASTMTTMQQINGHSRVHTDLVLTASSCYGAAAWDCGSALFDAFELVAMSKKLEDAHQLNHASIEKVCLPAEGAFAETQFETFSDADEVGEEETQFQHNHKFAAWHTTVLSHRLSEDSDTSQLPPDQTQSRQAVYDMFCRYKNPETQGGIFSDDQSNREHMRKLKPGMPPVVHSKQYRRRRLAHSLSSTFRQHIAQLAGRSRASLMANRPPDKLCLSQSLSLPAKGTAVLQHQSHSLPTESMTHLHRHSHKTAHAALPQAGIKSMASKMSESHGIRASNYTLSKQSSSDTVHHHYHHHYHHHHHHHYRFRRHSDEGFLALPEPLLGADKSLLVAAAGLGTAKISSLQDYLSLNPKLEGTFLDNKRKLKDANMGTTPIQSPLHI